MSHSNIIKESVINPQHYELFEKQQNVGFGFTWKQRQMMMPGKGAMSMPTWQAFTNTLEGGQSPRPQFVLAVRRSGISPVPLLPTNPAPDNIAPKAPIAPTFPKVFGRYILRLYMQPSGGYEAGSDSVPIFEAVIDGLEEHNQPFGLKEYLQRKFKINNVSAIKVWPTTRIAHGNFGNWYTGNLPDPKQLEQYLGSGTVDFSQIASAFNGVGKATSMVNQFDGSLLRNIAFIFNTAGNAYGVYIPALDQAINNEKTKNLLKQKGCIVEDLPNGAFTARPEDPNKISPQQVQAEINRIENEMKTQGGHAFGVNMNLVLESAKKDQANIQQKTSKDFDLLAMAHLGETMAHEATHAKGHQDEGAPQSVQQSFIQWIVPKINEERRQIWLSENQGSTPEQYIPIQITSAMRHANWYRQLMYKLSFADKGFANGTMYQGRFRPSDSKSPPNRNEGTVPTWAGMFWKGPHAAIENMLEQSVGEFSNKDSIEKRMRVQRRKSENPKLDHNALTSELIDEDRKPTDAYSSTEKLLEDQRPKPLILSSAEQMTKLAYTDGVDAAEPGFENFGWMQNLRLDERERMKTGVEVDDDLATNQDESIHSDRVKSIRFNPRYNPEYSQEDGCRGMFHSFWYEPRWEPERWDDMVDERTRTSPGSRFASADLDRCRELADFILLAMQRTQESITQQEFKGTRFLVSPHLATAIADYFQGEAGIRVVICAKSNHYVPVWVIADSIDDAKVERAEKFARGIDSSPDAFEALDEISCLSQIKHQTIDAILKTAKEICQSNGLKGIYLVGGFPRSLVLREKYAEIRDLDFSSAYPDECLKLGGLLAEKLGVKNPEIYHRTMTLSWIYDGIKCDFRGKVSATANRALFREKGIKTTPLNLDVYSRDLTINMLIYNLDDGKVYDVTRQSVADLKSRVLQTYFPAETVVAENPLIILRALKYENRYDGFTIVPELQKAMHDNLDKLSQFSPERIEIGVQDILREGKTNGERLLREYDLQQFLPKGQHDTN